MHALDAIEIALMHAIDADEVDADLWRRHFVYPDLDRLDRYCAVLDDAFGPEWCAVAHF